jgi:nucleotide-binding universal stress UspA family protein
MLPPRRVLVPTDFSDLSDAAVEAAISLARGQSAEILLVHVQEQVVDHYGFGGSRHVLEMQERIDAVIRAQLDEAADRVQKHGLKVRCYERQGRPEVEIVKLAREADADLIVMGTHGRSGLEHALLGSTTERVLRKAPCSVLTVRAKAPAP